MNILHNPLTKAAALAGVVTVLFCNSHFFSYAPYGGYLLVPDCFFSYGVHFLFYLAIIWLAGLNRFFAWCILPILLATQMYCYQAEVNLGVDSSELGVATMNASWNEVGNYANFQYLSLLFAGIAGIFLISFLTRHISIQNCRHIWLITAGILLACVVTCSLAPISRSLRYHTKHKDLWPLFMKAYQPAFHTLHFWSGIWTFIAPNKLKPSTDYASRDTFSKKPDIVVLYIGEAIRPDHSPLNGYHRNTTPGIGQCSNIINLPNVLSAATQTLPSIFSILTYTTDEEESKTHSSFVDILAKHSYKQYLMAGLNTEGYWYLTPNIAKTLNPHVSLHSRPASAQEYAKNISDLLTQKSAPLFVLIEDGAGHMPYKSEHNIFGQASDIDKYDNCILDADARLTAIIQTLQSNDAILLFTSDHGESFGEEGRFGHAGPMTAMEQRQVFSFIWYSNSYAEKHPEIIQALKDNALRFTSHDHIYHTIISVAGIQSDIQLPAQDMTRPQ